MCEVVEISDDDEEENIHVCISDSPNSIDECSQNSFTALTATSSSLNSAPQDISTADRKKAEREAKKKEREERKALKEREKEERKTLREQLRLEKKREKAKEKATAKAIKEVLKATDQENRPGERVKNMVVHLDSRLSQRTEMMIQLLTELKQLNVEHVMESSDVPNLVRWHRKLTNRTINDDATIVSSTLQQDEQHLLVVMDAGELAQLVKNGRADLQGRVNPSSDHPTCEQFVKNIQRGENKRITLAIVGMDAFERGLKNKFNRDFRRAVLTQGPLQTSDTGGVDKSDLEQSLIELELSTGCSVRDCQDDEKLAELIIQTTKAIADAPFKRKNVFSFHDDLGPGPSKKDCTTQNKLSMTWQHQLLQFPNTGTQTVTAITNHYPTPSDLIKAYRACDSEDVAARLLQDIMVVRSTSRRLGPVLSKKIHRFLTSTDATTLLD